MPQAATTRTSLQWNGVPRKPACMPAAKCRTGKMRAIQRIQDGVLLSNAMKMPGEEQQREDAGVDDGAGGVGVGDERGDREAERTERGGADREHHEEPHEREAGGDVGVVERVPEDGGDADEQDAIKHRVQRCVRRGTTRWAVGFR